MPNTRLSTCRTLARDDHDWTKRLVLVGVGAIWMAATMPGLSAASGGASTPDSASDGTRTLTIDASQDLDPAGQQVRVTGSGYDESSGVYVSLCVIPPEGAAPSPCGGGQDRTGEVGASAWISSDPPSYAEGVPTPYGPGGTFDVTITVGAQITADLDCREIRCAIVTRNDHTRGSDRSQDLVVPVTFRAAGSNGRTTSEGSAAATTGAAPAATTTPTTSAASTTTTPTTTEPVAAIGAASGDDPSEAGPDAAAASPRHDETGAAPTAAAIASVGAAAAAATLAHRRRRTRPVR